MEQTAELKHYGIREEILSNDFIAGLIAGEGTFYWTKSGKKNSAAFALKMQIRDFDLVVNVKTSLNLNERVYEYYHNKRHYAFLIVRNFEGLSRIIENIYPSLSGYKKSKFIEWFKRFGDPNVVSRQSAIYHRFRRIFPELYEDSI